MKRKFVLTIFKKDVVEMTKRIAGKETVEDNQKDAMKKVGWYPQKKVEVSSTMEELDVKRELAENEESA